jgi:surfeit locus 1 family protein
LNAEVNVEKGAALRTKIIKVAALSRRLWWSALIVLAGMAIMIRLGFWQLDRLAQRRAYNAELVHQLALPPLSLAGDVLPIELRAGGDLAALKNRSATARGTYDFSHQVVLKLQSWQGQPGAHLITPLLIEGSSRAELAVLVDRGWVPYTEATPQSLPQFDEPGPVTVTGFIQLSQPLPTDSSRPAGPQTEWYRLDIAALQAQMPYQLLPVYIQQSPPPGPGGNVKLPYRVEPVFDLSDGPHLSYAIQWYSFALIFGGGYVYYVYKNAAAFMPHQGEDTHEYN